MTLALSSTADSTLRRVHLLLGAQTGVILLGSLNRLGPWTLGYAAENEFLRWVDFHNMLTLPLISVSAFFLLKVEVERKPRQGSARAALLLNLAFVAGLYLLGASYGNHEVTNYLHSRYCDDGFTGALCDIIVFNDDQFSHWLFFIAFVLVNGALLALQVVHPWTGQPSRRDVAILLGNALFVALGIFANLGFEEIGLDLVVVVLLAALSFWLLWRQGRQPLFIYYAAAYGLGLGATVVARLVT